MTDVTREIEIDEPRATVWDLLADVGWWLGPEAQTLGTREDATLDVVVHADRGRYRIRTEEYQPRSYLSYRCLADGGRPTTLVEFFVLKRQRLGARARTTVVRVVESGFRTEDQRDGSHQEWGERLYGLQSTALRGQLWPWLEEQSHHPASR